MYHVNVLENVINRQDKNNRRRTVSTFIEKGDKPELKKVLFFFGNGEKFCLPMMYLLRKFRTLQTRLSRKSTKISLQSKRISKRSGRCCIDERGESIQRRKERILQVAPNCAALKSPIFTMVVVTFILDVIELSY